MRHMEEIEYLNAENGNLKKRIKSLEEDAEIRCNTMCKLYERINELELTAKSFDAEIARSPDRIQKLTTENADLVMEVEKLQERIKELEKVVEEKQMLLNIGKICP